MLAIAIVDFSCSVKPLDIVENVSFTLGLRTRATPYSNCRGLLQLMFLFLLLQFVDEFSTCFTPEAGEFVCLELGSFPPDILGRVLCSPLLYHRLAPRVT